MIAVLHCKTDSENADKQIQVLEKELFYPGGNYCSVSGRVKNLPRDR